MNNENTQKDLLGQLFTQLPNEELPAGFRTKVMQQVMLEAVRIRKRNERLGWIAVILASLVMVTLAILSFIFLKVPQITIQHPGQPMLAFYGSIGLLTLLLLFADYSFRRYYKGE